MNTQTEALKLALDFLMTRRMGAESVIDALQEALAQPEQKPVAGVVIRDNVPTLLQDRHIKQTDERLYKFPQAQQEQGELRRLKEANQTMLDAAEDAVARIKSQLLLLRCDDEFIAHETQKLRVAIAIAKGEKT